MNCAVFHVCLNHLKYLEAIMNNLTGCEEGGVCQVSSGSTGYTEFLKLSTQKTEWEREAAVRKPHVKRESE